MDKFQEITSTVIPLIVNNIDTDQIIPARYLKVTDKKGLGANLFADWRYGSDGTPKADFILNKPEYQHAQILLCGDNFGSGSSREHAPWALTDFGIKAVISTSFADIFRNNSLKNGLLPIIVTPEMHSKLVALVRENPQVKFSVNLTSQVLVVPGESAIPFEIDGFSKACLLNGVDELGYLMTFIEKIQHYEVEHGKA